MVLDTTTCMFEKRPPTRKHDSWLNIAEIKFGTFERDLHRGTGGYGGPCRGVGDAAERGEGQFTADDARMEFPKLYATIHG